MLTRTIRTVIVPCVLFGLAAALCAAQEKPAKEPRGKPATPTSGAKLYKQNCALCHGDDGKGSGPPPANSPFAESPPDLTTLAQRHEGKFPEAYVMNVLRSGVKMPGHGPAEMPVWGTLFQTMTKSPRKSDETQATLRITNLTNYIKSLQVK
jgi:mono/diheme cytochrome c family protein